MDISTNELMNVKGVKIPDFTEPKGEAFEKVIKEIREKVERLRVKKSNYLDAVEKCNSELQKIKLKLITTEDHFEIIELKKKKFELQEELAGIEDLSHLDIKGYARELINQPSVQQLIKEAAIESRIKSEQIKQYQDEITKQYKKTMAVSQKFVAGFGSEASYNVALRIYNNYL